MMDTLDDFVKNHQVDVVTLTVPKRQAVEIAHHLEKIGIKAIWNFAPIHLVVPEKIVLQSENLAVSLTALRLQLKRQQDQKAYIES